MTDTLHTDTTAATCTDRRPLLTVVVPVYRVERTLDEAVESILAQEVDMEVVLVDDGSPDRCPTLCDAWAARDARIRTIHRPNGGLSAARNDGIAAARGEYITFVDSDDRLDADTYAPLMATLLAHPEYDMIEYGVRCEGRPDGYTALRPDEDVYDTLSDWWLGARGYAHTYAWNKIFRRGLFDGLRFPEGRTFEDAHTIPLAIARARRVATTPHGTYVYRWNPDGITAHATAADLSDLLDAHLAVLRMLGWDMQGHDRSTKSRSPQKNRSTKSRSTQKNWSTRDEQTYWLHATNIQITLCRLTGERPRLPRHWFNPLYFTGRNRLKAIVLDLFGVEGVARMFGRER